MRVKCFGKYNQFNEYCLHCVIGKKCRDRMEKEQIKTALDKEHDMLIALS